MTDDDLPDPLLIQHVWRLASRWAVPVMMTLAYVFLAATSETNNTGRMWMLVGLVFVMCVWFTFRELTEQAGLARALSVGDLPQLETIAHRQLAASRRPATRARPLVARAFAHLLRGQHAEALATLDELAMGPRASKWLGAVGPLASAIRVIATIELGRPVDAARAAIIRMPDAPALAWLADGVLAWHDGARDQAAGLLDRAAHDVRAGTAVRELAQRYRARVG
ncbi:MAG TPA: hypothetical protein VGC42_20430 [Kofleriaceae bacterium]